MSELTVGILGFVCIVAIVITLFKSKTMPSMAFIIFPSILGLILVLGGYYTIGEIGDLINGIGDASLPQGSRMVAIPG